MPSTLDLETACEPMNCPKCETHKLEATRVNDVELDRCSQCRGIWFDAHELDTVLGLDSKETHALKKGKPDDWLNRKHARCPRDGSEMLRVYSASNHEVILDQCGKCGGIWLDGGEFAKLSG
ncbi:MAG: zf-TFIIB domain-containing protein [Planctomycetales bacterium]|nr:zf-TFIIB domain-containing protein [Planctomycetales bacterium]